eukprot:m.74671 g.74671  ORF g.74671 m.74671 type:complete len:788 (+) comp8935_c0_seq1:338-2701(+)
MAGAFLHNAEGGVGVFFVMLSILLGAVCRVLNRNLPIKIPYTVTLFIVGLIWGSLPDDVNFHVLNLAASKAASLDAAVLLFTLLPIIMFYSAFTTQWVFFRTELVQTLILATFGVMICTGLTGVVMKYVLQPDWSWAESLLLGAIISNTNPVSVVALMKECGLPTPIVTVFQTESMINGATSVVLYDLFFQLAGGSTIAGPRAIAEAVARLSLGAVAFGSLWAIVAIWLIGRVKSDQIVEMSLVFAPVYLLYYTAQFHLKMSGVLAVTTFGICFPWWGNTRISPGLYEYIEGFLGNMSHVAETLVFVIAGVLVVKRVGDTFEGRDYGRAVLLWALSNGVRLTMLVILAPVLRRTGHGFGPRRALIFAWGGLRGAVPLVLAVLVEIDTSIPESVSSKILGYTAFMTALTLLVNAPLTEPLLRLLTTGASTTTWGTDDASKEQFRRGVINMTHSTQLHLHEMKQVPMCGPEPYWDSVTSFVCEASKRTIRQFPDSGGVGDVYHTRGDEVGMSDALALKQGRLLFLRAVKENYAKQEASGRLRWTAAALLCHVADALDDSISTSSQVWECWSHDAWGEDGGQLSSPDRIRQGERAPVYEGEVSRVAVTVDRRGRKTSLAGHEGLDLLAMLRAPKWLGWCRRNFPSWPLSALIRRAATNILMDRINAIDGLIHGYQAAAEFVQGRVSPYTLSVVRAESEDMIRMCEELLLKYAIRYPDAFRQARSASAAQHLLAYQLMYLQTHASAFTSKRRRDLVDEVKHKQMQLVLNTHTFDVPETTRPRAASSPFFKL